jgi:hypothetical protein
VERKLAQRNGQRMKYLKNKTGIIKLKKQNEDRGRGIVYGRRTARKH